LRPYTRLEEAACLGCSVCVPACTRGGLKLARRPERVIPPRDTVRRCVLMALEHGNLADLVFDEWTLASHRALVAVLGAILKLPPVKRALATEQVRSVYLERLIERAEARGAT